MNSKEESYGDMTMKEKNGARVALKATEKDHEQPTYETLLDSLGHFGKFQRIVFALSTLTDITNGMVLMYLIFSSSTPNWRCTQFAGLNMTDITEKNASFEKTCRFNDSRCVQFEFDVVFHSIAAEWSLVCDDSYIPKLTTSIMMSGLMVGAFIFAQLADTYGRRPFMIVICPGIVLMQAIVGTSASWIMHAVMRFFVGVLVGGAVELFFVFPLEFIGPKWRSFCSSIGLYEVGHSLLALLAYLLRDWRYLAYATSAFSLPIALAIIVYVPESVRWLIQKERFNQAEKVVKRMAKVNKKEIPDLSILRLIAKTDKMARRKRVRYTCADLFTTKKYAIRTVVLMVNWFTVSCVFYNITISISSLTGDMFLNTVLSSLPAIFACWTVIPVANCIGRKKCYLVYSIVPISAMFAIVILQATGQLDEQTKWRTAFALIGRIGVSCTWNVGALITTEVYPTLTRTVGYGIGNVSARVGGILAPQIVFLGEMLHWTVPYVINGSLALTSCVLILLLIPETNKTPLPEDLPEKTVRCCRRSNDLEKEDMEESLHDGTEQPASV